MVLVCFYASAGNLPPCSQETQNLRHELGPQMITHQLYQQLIMAEDATGEDDFWDETFQYIGQLSDIQGRTYTIGFLVTIWGSACRSTKRLFIYNAKGVVLGQYYINAVPTTLKKQTLWFDADSRYGNKIDFMDGPPKKIWIDGEVFKWLPFHPQTNSFYR